ncbi:MAG: TetR/AcrR family transcriptional regulator [Desulfobacterales bacterium]|nr:TetR/AcrR family transcriptional regulator [Desulfobacterales bacterium]
MNKNSKITRSEQKQLTRNKLIQATYDVIAHEGLSGVTLAKVAKTAGFSRGISNFHFESKERLLTETLKFMYRDFEASWRKISNDTTLSPVDKLVDIITTSLHPPLIEFRKIIVWFAFSSEFHTRDTFIEINKNHDREWENSMENLIRQIADDSFTSHNMSLNQIIISLTSMITGFWMEFYLNPDRRNPENAVNTCLIFLSNFFPVFKTRIKNPSRKELALD